MVLTVSQGDGIKALYGEDVAGAERALKILSNKRGVLRIFNEDGSVNISKEELEKKLNKQPKQSKPRVKVSSDELVQNIVSKLMEVKSDIKKLTDLKEYGKINHSFKVAYEELKNRKVALKDIEVKRLQSEIEKIQDKIKELNGEK